ncbi:MAG: DUF4384 domain-containing protein [Bryobacterales bacterium]|nr:DUF4384 domain-containing protein [Bryobacterales bacterium]
MNRLLWIACAAMLGAQTRGIVPEDLIKARPAPAAAKPAAAPKPRYQPVGAPPVLTAANVKQVGVTIWKLRPALAADQGARILVQEPASTLELIPERVGSGTALNAGDRVRISIEAGSSGYLYVIDRERYASGEGDAYLIFPTTRTRGGDNRVTAGKLIEIPAQEDQPNYFTLRRSRPDQTGEELLVIVSEAPLDGITIGPSAIKLTAAQVRQWELDGKGKVERFELSGGAGKAWTRSEQQAGQSGTRVLTQEEPPPQTVYRVAPGAGKPALVRVELRMAK